MKWLSVLLLMPMVSMAQVFVSPNRGGGEIVLTSRPCVVNGKKYDNLREAYSWTNDIGKLEACWTIQDGNVHMVYLRDSSVRIYPLDSFTRRD